MQNMLRSGKKLEKSKLCMIFQEKCSSYYIILAEFRCLIVENIVSDIQL